MKLLDALQLLRRPAPDEADPFCLFLACGFMPLHLETFLAAHVRRLRPGRPVAVETGPFGDLPGTLDRMAASAVHAGAVVIEWADLDPRLGLRRLGGWSPSDLPDIARTAEAALHRLGDALAQAAPRAPVALCLPTLPLPPFQPTAGGQAGDTGLRLRERVAAFARHAADLPGVRLVAAQRLDQVSPPGQRLDVKADLLAGFPYTTAHASAVGELLARLVAPPPPKKGLITDLDETLWRGILGEAGAEGVAWDLDRQAQTHGLYQQLLRSLAEAGVLLAVASKNAPELVEEVFARPDVVLPRDRLFPMEVHWGRKSDSVARILEAWNVGPESVVLVDDSPLELAEVAAAFPEVQCLRFPTDEPQGVYRLLERLRDLFGKERVGEEDALRLESVRSARRREQAAARAGPSADEFLAQTQATVTLDFSKGPDARAFELVNKTNQFNLNGRRLTEAEWQARLDAPETFRLVAAYEDKFGPLGKIAVVLGRRTGGDAAAAVDTWVMSCRAFGRRIEHRCLEQLFEHLGAQALELDVRPTERNAPLRDFLAAMLGRPLDAAPAPVRLSRDAFAAACPLLPHRVRIA